MQIPLQISFRNMEPSEAIASRVRERAAHLEKYYKKIISCRVMVDEPHRRHHIGNHFHIRIDVKVPGKELVVDRNPPLRGEYKDIYVSIRDAFDSMEREIRNYIRIRRREVKTPHLPPQGTISQIHKDDDYGFISADGGREIYFHKNSVLKNRFEDLEIGMEVRFMEELGDSGPQASTVVVIGRASKHTSESEVDSVDSVAS